MTGSHRGVIISVFTTLPYLPYLLLVFFSVWHLPPNTLDSFPLPNSSFSLIRYNFLFSFFLSLIIGASSKLWADSRDGSKLPSRSDSTKSTFFYFLIPLLTFRFFIISKLRFRVQKISPKRGEAIVNSKHFVKDHLGLDIIINQSV